MSRKRGKNKPAQAVPDEILAEGSGANEVVDANAQSLADAASDALGAPDDQPVVSAAEVEGGDAIDNAEAAAVRDEELLEDAVMRAEAEAELGEGEEPGGEEEAADELGAALPTTAASMDPAQLKKLVEALVFAADKPVTLQRLRQLTRVSDVKRLEAALGELAAEYVDRGIALQQVSGGYQFRTNTQFSVWVQQLIAGRPVRLSRAQLETLAIVAYRQPITRPEVDEIRGVDSSATLRLLLDRSLIRILGKKEEVGRPMLYGTTKEFLDFFSLGDLRELPTLREYSELTAESRKVMSDRLGMDADGEIGADAEAHVGDDVAASEVASDVAGVESVESVDDVVASYMASEIDAVAGDEAVATAEVIATDEVMEAVAGDEVIATDEVIEAVAAGEATDGSFAVHEHRPVDEGYDDGSDFDDDLAADGPDAASAAVDSELLSTPQALDGADEPPAD